MEEETRTNETTTNESTAQDQGQSATGPTDQELVDELNRLGTRFAEVIQTAWNSEERKRIQADLSKGIAAVSASLEEGFHKVSENQKTQGLVDQADDVMTNVGDKVRSSDVTHDLSRSLAKGLRKASDQLEKWVAEMESKPESGDAAGNPTDDTQDIPIHKA